MSDTNTYTQISFAPVKHDDISMHSYSNTGVHELNVIDLISNVYECFVCVNRGRINAGITCHPTKQKTKLENGGYGKR